jgi:hypothetical protein
VNVRTTTDRDQQDGRATAARRRSGAALAVAAALVTLAGCGVGAGETAEDVGLRVTDRFGTEPVLDRPQAEVEGEDTVARLLQRNADVETSGGGTFVAAIEGRAGGEPRGDATPYWIFFRNGVFSDEGAAGDPIVSGERIWWDRHDQRIANVQAVVGSFPMPFAARDDDGAVSVELGCADPAGAACTVAAERLTAAGVAVTAGELQPQSAPARLRVLVGPWTALRRDPVAARLEREPRTSGVLARIRGTRLTPFRADGTAAEPLDSGWGVIAATRTRREPVTWVVAGRSAADAEAAAEQLTEDALAGRFALLVRDGVPEALPVPGAR